MTTLVHFLAPAMAAIALCSSAVAQEYYSQKQDFTDPNTGNEYAYLELNATDGYAIFCPPTAICLTADYAEGATEVTFEHKRSDSTLSNPKKDIWKFSKDGDAMSASYTYWEMHGDLFMNGVPNFGKNLYEENTKSVGKFISDKKFRPPYPTYKLTGTWKSVHPESAQLISSEVRDIFYVWEDRQKIDLCSLSASQSPKLDCYYQFDFEPWGTLIAFSRWFNYMIDLDGAEPYSGRMYKRAGLTDFIETNDVLGTISLTSVPPPSLPEPDPEPSGVLPDSVVYVGTWVPTENAAQPPYDAAISIERNKGQARIKYCSPQDQAKPCPEYDLTKVRGTPSSYWFSSNGTDYLVLDAADMNAPTGQYWSDGTNKSGPAESILSLNRETVSSVAAGLAANNLAAPIGFSATLNSNVRITPVTKVYGGTWDWTNPNIETDPIRIEYAAGASSLTYCDELPQGDHCRSTPVTKISDTLMWFTLGGANYFTLDVSSPNKPAAKYWADKNNKANTPDATIILTEKRVYGGSWAWADPNMVTDPIRIEYAPGSFSLIYCDEYPQGDHCRPTPVIKISDTLISFTLGGANYFTLDMSLPEAPVAKYWADKNSKAEAPDATLRLSEKAASASSPVAPVVFQGRWKWADPNTVTAPARIEYAPGASSLTYCDEYPQGDHCRPTPVTKTSDTLISFTLGGVNYFTLDFSFPIEPSGAYWADRKNKAGTPDATIRLSRSN